MISDKKTRIEQKTFSIALQKGFDRMGWIGSNFGNGPLGVSESIQCPIGLKFSGAGVTQI